jgi:hypothetical protein
MTVARIALFVVVALALAVAANLALLGIATGPKDPVGRLTPQAGLVRLPAAHTTTAEIPSRLTPRTPPPPPTHRDGETPGRSSQQDD